MGIIFKDFLLAQFYLKKATPFENYIQLGVLLKSLGWKYGGLTYRSPETSVGHSLSSWKPQVS